MSSLRGACPNLKVYFAGVHADEKTLSGELMTRIYLAGTTGGYKGEEKPCGKCGSCTERLEAFESAGSRDPLEYQ